MSDYSMAGNSFLLKYGVGASLTYARVKTLDSFVFKNKYFSCIFFSKIVL